MRLDDGLLACAAVFSAAMAAYLLTLCPTVYAGDSGDFITASYTLGVAHPTGYPLYMLLGKAFSTIPFGNVAYRYNVLSAVFAAAAAVFACLTARLLVKSWLASAGAGLLVAFSQAYWDQATVAEVYGLNGLFAAALTWLALRWRLKRDGGTLIWFAVAYGLALTNHLSMLLYAPAYIYLISSGVKSKPKGLGWGRIASAFSAPLSLYLYVPLRAMANPPYNWGDPSTIEGFLRHVTGSVHRQTVVLTLTASGYVERFIDILRYLMGQCSVAGVLAAYGLYAHSRRNRVFFNFTAIMACADLVYTLFLNDVSLEVTTFFMPTIVVLAVWSSFGFEDSFRWLRRKGAGAAYAYVFVVVVLGSALAANYGLSDKSGNLLAYDYATNVLRTVDKGAVIFAEGDNTVMPLMYLMLVEKARGDVSVYDRQGILSHGLYGPDYFWMPEGLRDKRQYDVEYAMVEGGRPVYYTFKPDLEYPGYMFQQTGLLYRVVPENETLPNRDYWGLYDTRQVWNATIHLDYMSRNIRASYYARMADWQRIRNPDLALSLLAEAAAIVPDNMNLRYDAGTILLSRGNFTGAARMFEEAVRISPDSAKAHNNLGYALAMSGDEEGGLREYTAALALDPTYLMAKANLAGILMKKGELQEAARQYVDILKSDPRYAKAYFNLGLIYYRAGRTAQAAGMWERYLELEPRDSEVRRLYATVTNSTARGSGAAPVGGAGP